MLRLISAKKTDKDGKLIMKWRNDPVTRSNSLNPNLKIWDTFKLEFYDNYFKNIPLFALFNNKKVAFVSFLKITDDTYKIGINIAPEYRGKGLSTKIILVALCYVKVWHSNVKQVLAEIKSFNIPSVKTFTKAGFVCKSEGKLNTYVFKL